MSRSVDLFVDSPLPIDALAELLAARSALRFEPGDDPDCRRASLEGVTAELYAHRYADDGELWLSRYRYALSARMSDGVVPLDSAQVTVLRHLAQQLHDPADLPVLLVLDLQYRLGGPLLGVPVASGGTPPDALGMPTDGPSSEAAPLDGPLPGAQTGDAPAPAARPVSGGGER